MMEEMTELIASIESLTREEAMEAALALAQELGTGEEPQGQARLFVEAVETAPLQHIEETEELARVILVAAAADEDLVSTLREILDAVGSKAFILGGLEIVALASLAVAAVHILVSKGRSRENRELELDFDKEGNVTKLVIRGTTDYGISADLKGLVAEAATDL